MRALRWQILWCASVLCAAGGAMAAEEGDAAIGYPTVAAAFQALSADPQAKIKRKDGWVHISQDDGRITWTFVPRQHPSFPTVVRRDAVQKEAGATLVTRMLCEASRPACDALFERLRESDEARSAELAADSNQ